MVDLGQKKVELSTFFYAYKKSCRDYQQLCNKPNIFGDFDYLCCAYLLDTSSQFMTLKKASMYAGRWF